MKIIYVLICVFLRNNLRHFWVTVLGVQQLTWLRVCFGVAEHLGAEYGTFAPYQNSRPRTCSAWPFHVHTVRHRAVSQRKQEVQCSSESGTWVLTHTTLYCSSQGQRYDGCYLTPWSRDCHPSCLSRMVLIGVPLGEKIIALLCNACCCCFLSGDSPLWSHIVRILW